MITGTASGSSRSAGELATHGCKIAPIAYYAARRRPPSAKAVRDAVVLEHIRRVHSSPRIGRCLYGAKKVYKELDYEQVRGEHPELGAVPRCSPSCPSTRWRWRFGPGPKPTSSSTG